MSQGDITYVDEALYENKLSAVFEDLGAARQTMDRIREFAGSHPKVCCGTHTPRGNENPEGKRGMDLEHPAETIFDEYDF